MVTQATLRFARNCELGEGALWDVRDQVLYWVDILQNEVLCFDPSNDSHLVYAVGENVGTVVLSQNGKALLALRSGFASFDFETRRLKHLTDPESDKAHTRFNDGKCDPRGRFWAGTMVEDDRVGDGALYCMDTELRVHTSLTGVTCSNGLVWSNDQRQFFYIDSPTHQVQCFDFDVVTGHIGKRRILIEFTPEMGLPDGMAIDSDDGLWVAFFGGRRVVRVDSKSGNIDGEVLVDAPNVTSCAFGGPGLNELFITTARVGMTDAEKREFPNAGSLFSVVLPVRGQPSNRFARDL